jgi:peptidoglycan-associated lipoprotein
MRKTFTYALICVVAITFAFSCKPKTKPTPPPPPQAKEQPKVEKVIPPPPVVKAEPTEQEIFMSKSLEALNKEKPLQAIYFDFDKYNVRDDAKPVLESNAAWLKKWASTKILIEGHCDERGTEEYNLALGEKRAKGAFDYLISLGVPAERLKILSYGKSQPLDMGHDEVAWAKNRRAQFLIIEK